MSKTMFQQIRGNKIKSIFIMAIFVILIAFLGAILGYIYGSYTFGIIVTLIAGAIYMLIAYNSGKNMILKMTGAKEVTKKEYPHLFHTIEGLSLAAGIPTPKAYVIDDSALNAFATGKDPKNSAVVVTTGLLKTMNRQELEGVIAHELSHIKNYDIRVMLLAAVLVGIAVLLSDFLLRSFLFGGGRNRKDSGNLGLILIVVGIVLAILTPLIGELIKLAISRKREYLADASGAQLTRYPPGLASALEKISNDPDPLVDKANKATAHLFISTPFRKKKGFFVKLFATHPPIEERIQRLKTM
jgi:heat shock protein HtpX